MKPFCISLKDPYFPVPFMTKMKFYVYWLLFWTCLDFWTLRGNWPLLNFRFKKFFKIVQTNPIQETWSKCCIIILHRQTCIFILKDRISGRLVPISYLSYSVKLPLVLISFLMLYGKACRNLEVFRCYSSQIMLVHKNLWFLFSFYIFTMQKFLDVLSPCYQTFI